MQKEKEITIYDIADQLNISVATVSRALKDDPVVNKKTKKLVSDLAEKLGYRSNHFARNLRNRRTDTIGVIVPRLNSYFMSTVITGIENVANNEGYDLIISQSSESSLKEKANAKTMFNNRVDGLLVSLAYDSDNISYFDPFYKKNIPVIFFDRGEQYNDFTNVLIDNRKAGYEATKHLTEQGCRRIIHITALPKRNVYVDRLNGYKQALSEKNIEFKEEYIVVNNLSQEAGEQTAEIILKMDPLPDGIFASNDNCAVSCMLALKKAGIRIPEGIAVVGFNNDPVSMVIEPNLTTINYPGYEMGAIAARNLIGYLNGSKPVRSTQTIVLRSDLIIRASSKRLPQQA
ncbi:MAG TPA: LacI family DNA-binding transcriptional regulator [Chitinophagaceae bacterium]|jgi:LacI family transcriptional regulator|nr:LacI family DNA-binding transcriptional regulator [Chitinophagaceae bacterium]